MTTQPEKIPVEQRRADNAMEILTLIDQSILHGQSADHALAHLYRERRRYGSRDRKFYSAAVFGWFRWHGILRTLKKNNPQQAAALAVWLDGETFPDELRHLQLPEALLEIPSPENLSDKLKLLRENVPELAQIQAPQLLPSWVTDLCTPEDMAPTDFENLLIEATQQRPPTWFRIRPQNQEKTLRVLRHELTDLQQHPDYPSACCTRQRFNATQLFKQTKAGLEVQDLASQLTGKLCAPRPGQHWWDLCAGSGGKTLLLADLMRDQGSILATDVRPHILKNLNKRVQQANLHSIQVALIKNMPAKETPFDGILIDAPCSGIGTWSRNPDARWRISERYIIDRAAHQEKLLNAAAPCLKPGGRLVYSVCTLSRAETTDLIRRFLQGHPEYRFEPFYHPLTRKPAHGCCFIHPWQGPCNGMFIALLTRQPVSAQNS